MLATHHPSCDGILQQLNQRGHPLFSRQQLATVEIWRLRQVGDEAATVYVVENIDGGCFSSHNVRNPGHPDDHLRPVPLRFKTTIWL